MDLAIDPQVPKHLADKYEREAGHYWDLFYRRNGTKFFYDRHWFAQEFPQLLTAATVLEVGCGVGNTAFPLLEINPTVRVYACDFAPSAVELVRSHPQYASGRVTAFQADITTDDLTAHVPPGSADVATMIFVLSAIAPGPAQRRAIRRVAAALRPGGQLLFRDYAEGDLAQERLGGQGRQQRLAANCFVRWDGTLSVYFSEAGLRELFEGEGFRCEYVRASERTVENRKRGEVMGRRFVQAVFTYTGERRPDGGSGSSGDGSGVQQAADMDCAQQQRGDQQLSPQQQPQQQGEEEVALRLGSTQLQLVCKPGNSWGQAAAEALAALVLACPQLFSGIAVLELCCWEAPLGALAALRWCRRAVAAAPCAAAMRPLRLNAMRCGPQFIIERLRLQQLAWGRPEQERQRAQQLEQLAAAVPLGFGAILAGVPADAAALPQLLACAAALLSREPAALLLLLAAGHAAAEQVPEAATAAGLRPARMPPELAVASAALAGGMQLVCLQHAPDPS